MKAFPKSFIVAALAAWLAGCVQLVPARAEPRPSQAEAESAWASVLERFVDDEGRVDYRALASKRADLDTYVAWIYANAPSHSASRQEVLAYHLNAYNALAMYNVLETGVPRSLSEYGLLRFFWLRRVRVGGDARSLHSYENDVIRPLGEERVHFALNCMAAGCPRLPRRPFRAATLDPDLEREARRFLNEPRNVQADPTRRVVRLSAIFRFYSEDFLAKEPSLIAYVNRYRTKLIPPDYRVEFIPYDWTVAIRP